jgi:hypothetical protein
MKQTTVTNKQIIKRCTVTIDGKEHGGVVVDKNNDIQFIDKSLIVQQMPPYGNYKYTTSDPAGMNYYDAWGMMQKLVADGLIIIPVK